MVILSQISNPAGFALQTELLSDSIRPFRTCTHFVVFEVTPKYVYIFRLQPVRYFL